MDSRPLPLKLNKQTWNDRVAVHAQSDFYNLDAFKKGGSSLHRFEREALGDVSGKNTATLAMPLWSRHP